MTSSPTRGHAPHHHRLLLIAAQHGNHAAAGDLLRRYEPLVHARVARLRLPAGVEREDIAQEARVGLLRAIRRWRPERGPFPAFADRCVTNHALKAIDTATTRKYRLLTYARPIDPLPDHHTRDGEPSTRRVETIAALPAPDTIVIAREQLAALAAQLPRLTTRERTVLLGVASGRSRAELALELGATRKAVSTALARARTKLTHTHQAAAA